METGLLLAALVLCAAAIILLFIKGKRRYGLLCFAATAIVLFWAGVIVDKNAKSEGFLSASDKRDAEQNSVFTASEWTDEKREKFAREKRDAENRKIVSANQSKYCSHTDIAYTKSKEFVKKQLKSPDSASFPRTPISVEKSGACSFRVISSVTSQNGFGANIKTNYQVTITYYPDENVWRGQDLILSPTFGVTTWGMLTNSME